MSSLPFEIELYAHAGCAGFLSAAIHIVAEKYDEFCLETCNSIFRTFFFHARRVYVSFVSLLVVCASQSNWFWFFFLPFAMHVWEANSTCTMASFSHMPSSSHRSQKIVSNNIRKSYSFCWFFFSFSSQKHASSRKSLGNFICIIMRFE